MERNKREPNPYKFDTDQPSYVVKRAALMNGLIGQIEGGKSSILLGARGMGKSVLLSQIEQALDQKPGIDTFVFHRAPPDGTVQDAVNALVYKLEERFSGDQEKVQRLRLLASQKRVSDVIDRYLEWRQGGAEQLVLLYDEFDAYADPPDFGRRFFNHLEDVRKKLDGRLVIVAAGGLSMLSLSTVLGSSFFTRKFKQILEPFGAEEIAALAEPFAEKGAPLSPDVLDEVRVASGGNVMLATYGLEQLWAVDAPDRSHVHAAYRRFKEHYNDTLDLIWNAIFDLDLSEIPFHVWRALQKHGGSLPQSELSEVRRKAKTRLKLADDKIFDMLRASGLIRMESSDVSGIDPIVVECIPSILALRPFDDEGPNLKGSLHEQLVSDLCSVLVRIQSMTQAFYRPDQDKKPILVPEGTFAGAMALGLDLLGWRCDLEPMSGAGYADIKARHPRFEDEIAVIEVKIWPRNDYRDIHEQVTDYVARGVKAFATVMIIEKKIDDARVEYERACLQGKVESFTWHDLGPPLGGYFEATKGPHTVAHCLLGLRRR